MITDTPIDALEGAYYAALHGKVTLDGGATIVPVYKNFADVQTYDPYYILIQNPSSVGAESKCDTDQDVTIQLVLYCRGAQINTANMRAMAAQVYELVYPDRGHSMGLYGFQNVNQKLVSDNKRPDMDLTNNVFILERIIIFKHQMS